MRHFEIPKCASNIWNPFGKHQSILDKVEREFKTSKFYLSKGTRKLNSDGLNVPKESCHSLKELL